MMPRSRRAIEVLKLAFALGPSCRSFVKGEPMDPIPVLMARVWATSWLCKEGCATESTKVSEKSKVAR